MRPLMVVKQTFPETPWKVVTEMDLARYCTHVCGGGFNVGQTSDAMRMLQRIYEQGKWDTTNLQIRRADSVNR